MANGGTLTELVAEGRGKGAILIVLVSLLSSGMSWWFSEAGRDAVDALRQEIEASEVASRQERLALRTEMIAFVLHEIAGNQGQSNDRMQVIIERFARNERDIEARIPRAEFEYFKQGVERHLESLERTTDALSNRVYGRSPRDSQQ